MSHSNISLLCQDSKFLAKNYLLYTTTKTSSDDIVLPKSWHVGEMKLLSTIDDPLKPSVVNEVTYTVDSSHVDAQWMQPDSSLYNQCRILSNLWPVPKTSILMPGNVQIHRQLLLSDVKISKETKIAVYNLLWKYNAIISKMIMI